MVVVLHGNIAVNPARAGMILVPLGTAVMLISKPRASGDDPGSSRSTVEAIM